VKSVKAETVFNVFAEMAMPTEEDMEDDPTNEELNEKLDQIGEAS
jgi:hypothetical protein